MEHQILPIESIRERDIDIILLEEFSTDNTFCEWFIKELNLPKLDNINGAWRSISDFGLGETDILFSYQSEQKKILVLIENKLDASFQNEQFLRYQKRAEEYCANNECEEAYFVLIAPNLYCENQNDFEDFISYEKIKDRLIFTGSKRNKFKAELLNIAIEKLRRGYQPVNSEVVQDFWNSYWNYVEKFHPTLVMKKPGIVPHNSDWPMLYDNRLPNNIVFYHKFAQGNVDATFKKFPEETEYEIKKKIPEFAEIVKHSKTFSIRMNSGKVDRTLNFENQIENIERGLTNLEKIRDWIINSGIITGNNIG